MNRLRLVLPVATFAILAALGACSAHKPAGASTSASTLSAYDDFPRHHGLLARVTCVAEAPAGSAWFDVNIESDDEAGMRLCSATIRLATCPAGASRVVRGCSTDALGPAPQVPRDAAILRQTTPAELFGATLDLGSEATPIRDASGRVYEYRVMPTLDTCIARLDPLTQRAREHHENTVRLTNARRVAEVERELHDIRAKLAALEHHLGKPVREHAAALKRKLARTKDEAERARLEQALVEADLLELDDARLRGKAAEDETAVASLETQASLTEPLESFMCFAPRGQPGS